MIEYRPARPKILGSNPIFQPPQDFGLVAQLVERLPEEQSVAGSIPAEFTKLMPALA